MFPVKDSAHLVEMLRDVETRSPLPWVDQRSYSFLVVTRRKAVSDGVDVQVDVEMILRSLHARILKFQYLPIDSYFSYIRIY